MRRDTVLSLLERHRDQLHRVGIVSLALFGSTARDEAHEDSDVDLLVSFREPPTFLGYMEAKTLLEDVLGARVDLVTNQGLLPRVRPKVLAEAIHVA